MNSIYELINQNVSWAPYIIFLSLLLAGLNLPISEDVVIIIAAMLAYSNPDFLSLLFLGVYLGAYGSDLISYGLGRYFGQRLWESHFFGKFLIKEKVDKIGLFYERYGTVVLIVGRFIPFGVRNALFFTAGRSRRRFLAFALTDLVACTVSVSLFFFLYYAFGNKLISFVKRGDFDLWVQYWVGGILVWQTWAFIRRRLLAGLRS